MDLACYSIGASVPLVFILPFVCSAPSLHPPPAPAGFPLTLPASASLSITGRTALGAQHRWVTVPPPPAMPIPVIGQPTLPRGTSQEPLKTKVSCKGA